ncbi:MAG: serine/threonine-protein kinase [Lentisphaeria bacterium]
MTHSTKLIQTKKKKDSSTEVAEISSTDGIGKEEVSPIKIDLNANGRTLLPRKVVHQKRKKQSSGKFYSENYKELQRTLKKGHYTLDKLAAKGAESVLYLAKSGSETLCVKSIRNFLYRYLGDLKTRKDRPKLKDTKYSTKCRHLKNEYAVSQLLDTTQCNDSIIKIYALRKIKFFAIEIGYDLIMEFVDGTDLSNRARLDQLSIKQKIDIMIQCTQALEYFHKHHLVHLDIKPSNFMLTPERRIVLIDFGVSVPTNSALKAITGTAGYLSPEQIARHRLTEATDIFALGVSFAYLFGGSPLPQDIEQIRKRENRKEAEEQLKTAPVPALESIPELAAYPALTEVIQHCTILKREERISSCASLLLNIKSACKEDGIPNHTHLVDTPGNRT